MQPQALTRVDGTVLGVRQIDIPAKPAVHDDSGRQTSAAMPSRVLFEVDVASTFSRYDGTLAANLTAVLPVTYDDSEPRPSAGEVVSLLVFPYSSVTRTRTGWLRRAAHRFVALVPNVPNVVGPASPTARAA